MTSNIQISLPMEEYEAQQHINDDMIAQIIMADDQYKKIIDKEESRKSEAYKLKYLKAKKQYYYKS